MRRPLEGLTAVVVGAARGVRADRLEALGRYFTVAVGAAAGAGGAFAPAAALWLEEGTYERRAEWLDRALCVCALSAARRPEHVALPAVSGPLPRRAEQLDPRRLYACGGQALAAALWAAALGCRPVVLVGTKIRRAARPRGESGADGRQSSPAEAAAMAYRAEGDWRGLLWPWGQEVEREVVWASYVHSQRLKECDPQAARRRLRDFYARCGTPPRQRHQRRERPVSKRN